MMLTLTVDSHAASYLPISHTQQNGIYKKLNRVKEEYGHYISPDNFGGSFFYRFGSKAKPSALTQTKDSHWR
jgi:hypothetical protein